MARSRAGLRGGVVAIAAARLTLVRHGETSWNRDRRIQGQLDPPLNDTGLAQARGVARALAGKTYYAAYSSDLSRARQTAEAIAAPHGLPLTLKPALRERHYGIFQTLTYEEAREQHPDGYHRLETRCLEYDFGCGETLSALAARVQGCLTNIARTHPGQEVLVVTHGGVLDIAYRLATGMALEAPRDFLISNAGVSRLEADGYTWRIVAWNEQYGIAGLDDPS